MSKSAVEIRYEIYSGIKYRAESHNNGYNGGEGVGGLLLGMKTVTEMQEYENISGRNVG